MFETQIPDGAARREGRVGSHDAEYLTLYWHPTKWEYGRPQWILQHNAGVCATHYQDYEEACADNNFGLVEFTEEERDAAIAEAKQIQSEINEAIRGIGEPLDPERMGNEAQDLAAEWGWLSPLQMSLRQFLTSIFGLIWPQYLTEDEITLISLDLDEPIERCCTADDNGYTATAVLAGHTLYVDLKAGHRVHGEDAAIELLAGELYGDNWAEV